MKQEAKVIQIPPASTAAQMENALNNQLKLGFKLIAVFTLGTNTFAVLVRTVAN
ncbi:hypothetical protein HYW66_01430 [Candidatus Microgenomates bacterium]|nr:hypothetical protein [Candidatus Microgenomates bacterium]